MDKELVENVLRRASKFIPRISNFSYLDRLHAINTPSMKYGRLRGDMIQVYKILHCEDESLKAFFHVETIC